MAWTRRRFLAVGAGASAGVVLIGLPACSDDGGSTSVGVDEVPPPTDVLITRWADDPWARGSYSYLPVGATPDDRDTLAESVAGVLFFAGEATNRTNPSTVHGAIESGRRAAEEVADAVDPSDTVVVIGAGAAGLATAQSLIDDFGFEDVVVLEARNRTGGRIWTADLGGTPVDLGASWIHGVDGNPVSEIVDEAGIETVATDDEDVVVYGPDGFELPGAELAAAEGAYESALNGAAAQTEQLEEDRPLGEVLDDALSDLGDGELRTADAIVTAEIEHEYAADTDELSLFWWDEGEGYGGEEVVFPDGYGQVIDALTPDADLRLEQPVTDISWGEGGVFVETEDDEVEAAAVVVTIPLGVLQDEGPAFDPPLPEAKQEAIDRLGMGVLDKVYLRFDEVFWDDNELIAFVNGEDAGAFIAWLNFEPLTGQPILQAFNSGTVARELEEEDDEEITDAALDVLRTIYEP